MPNMQGALIMYYTGIGSRETPATILATMTALALKLEHDGWILRSGAAPGADSAFEEGVQAKDIYLPWPGFQGSTSLFQGPKPEAFEIAAPHHPYWDKLSFPVKKLMARNAHQVLGTQLDSPSDFIVCWTPDGCKSQAERTSSTGGTGLAISLADSLGIPVFNLRNTDDLSTITSWISNGIPEQKDKQ
jgi:hypothetical protein